MVEQEALRNVFKGIHSGNLQAVLNHHKLTLAHLKSKKVIRQNQWDILYPGAPKQADLDHLDITLLCVLLRNICGLAPSTAAVWKNVPNAADISTEADIVRIWRFRNERFSHIPNSNVNDADFKFYWAEISSVLVRLDIDQGEIDSLENEVCGGEVLKQLVRCDFQYEIKSFSEKFTPDTREWVFEQVSAWLNDKNSSNRAFVITGVAGMGKSVIAAVICKRFAEHIGACHFCQYNNTQYKNPQFLLQSLAWQLSKVFPEYKTRLIDQLSGNFGQSLNTMNVEGLFSMLFKQPFSSIPNPGKLVLIVLDAVDESTYDGRQELACLISNHFHKLPSYIRFVITTRPETNLMRKV